MLSSFASLVLTAWLFWGLVLGGVGMELADVVGA